MVSPEDLERFQNIILGQLDITELSGADQVYFTRSGLLTLLARDASQAAIQTLFTTAAESTDERLREQADFFLIQLANQPLNAAILALYRLAVHHKHPSAIQWIELQSVPAADNGMAAAFRLLYHTPQDYKQHDPTLQDLLTYVGLHSAENELVQRLILSADQVHWNALIHLLELVSTANGDTYTYFCDHYPDLSTVERDRLEEILTRQSSVCVPAAETICQIVIRYNPPSLRTFALDHRLEPSDPAQQTLFLFLTDQWARFESLDFDRRLIIRAYTQAEPALRARILEQARYSGQISWLEQAPRTRSTRWARDLTGDDWKMILRELVQTAQWDSLWRLAQAAPPRWSVYMLQKMDPQIWLPQNTQDQAALLQLKELAERCIAAKVELNLRTTTQIPGGSLSALAAFPTGQSLIAGGSGQQIYTWDVSVQHWKQPPLKGPAAQIRALAVSPNEEYLACANGDHRIRVYRTESGSLIKTFEGHSALIRCLVFHPDGRVLFSSGFDGTVRSWRFPNGPENGLLQQNQGEIFALAVSSEKNLVSSASADGVLRVWKWPEMQLLRSIPGSNKVALALAAGERQIGVSWGSENVLQSWNLVSGQNLSSLQTEDRIVQLAILEHERWVAALRQSGSIAVYELPDLHLVTATPPTPQPGIALLSLGADQVVAGDQSGKIHFWDTRLLNLLHQPASEQPAEQTLNLIHSLQKVNSVPANQNWLTFIEALTHWRARFDIQLSQPETFTVGPYDIQL